MNSETKLAAALAAMIMSKLQPSRESAQHWEVEHTPLQAEGVTRYGSVQSVHPRANDVKRAYSPGVSPAFNAKQFKREGINNGSK